MLREYDPLRTNQDAYSGSQAAMRLEVLRFAKNYSQLTADEEKELITLESSLDDKAERFIAETLADMWKPMPVETTLQGQNFTAKELAEAVQDFGKVFG